METRVRGKSLFGNIPLTGERGHQGGGLDTLRACNTGLVFSILLLLPEEVHTRPGVDGTKEATDGIGVWPCQAKFKGQEFHTALHGLSPTQATQGNHSIPDN